MSDLLNLKRCIYCKNVAENPLDANYQCTRFGGLCFVAMSCSLDWDDCDYSIEGEGGQ